jgi:hypothetical protein
MSAEDKSIIVLNFFVLYVYLNKHLIHNLVLLPLMIILSPQQGMIISNMIFSINYSVLIATFLYFIYPPIKEIPTIEHATAIGVDIYTIDAFFKIQYST